ncbi:MAG TPA: glycosyltransferase family 2 protein [Dehalococcoidia bacterium]|nr:glycosyltransferase family 2 protein [Dehalococcoidia bacterium]
MPEPFVTAIVPVRNEARYIERCLYTLARQDYPRERFEVLVVDGRSDDATRPIVSRFAAESMLDLALLDNPRRKTAAGLNIGLEAARGDVIVRVDGHAAVAPDFVRRSVSALIESGADCVGGVIESEGDTYAGRAIAIAMASRFGVGGAAFRVGGRGAADTVAFGAYRRDVFDRIGRFTETIDRGEDDEFNYRLRDAGGTIVLVPGIHARYTVRGGFGGLWRQYFGYGRAKPEVLRRHPSQARLRQLAPAALVLALAAAIARAVSGSAAPLRALAVVYTGAATIVSLALASQRRWRYLPLLPIAFACLHLSYGLGFIAGLMGLGGRSLVRAARPGIREGSEVPE